MASLLDASQIYLVLACAFLLIVATTASFRATKQGSADTWGDSDVIFKQPLTEATDWFLTEQEITVSRGGEPRTDLSVYTTGNAIRSFTITNEFYDSVYDDLTAVGEGQLVWMTSWDFKLVPLKPDEDVTGATTGVGTVFAGVVERGCELNILCWFNILKRDNNIKARDFINSLRPSPVNGVRGTFIFDDRLRAISSSHHQKTIIIADRSSSDPDGHPVAYVGGIDLTNDRWDTIYHNNSALRDASGITFHNKGWIDGGIRIHGPAAKDVANNFLARWNSDYKPNKSLKDDMLDSENPSFDKIDPLNYASSSVSSNLDAHSVQIVRTFSCKYKHYKEFAPHGELSLFQARIKAIKNAKNFIYIEDQYFVLVPKLLDALEEVMPRLYKVIVVANAPVGNVAYTGYQKYFYDMVSPLKKKYPDKLKVYTTKLDLKIYIHSKIVIIDDVYLSIGSANWNRRSMTSDSELNANVVDKRIIKSPEGITVNTLARNFRIRKFHELTGVSLNELNTMTFPEAANQFDAAAADNSSLLQTLEAHYNLYYIAFPDFIRQQFDPQDTCS
ncbi:unnamed protein product [Peronospora belbahrii]|uniref:phospholipase D n=1 Tax=Peronospora belbahrii TaxID=622444 RepID=A0AAU9LB81_9STRA|nr:unnamed protein product [Peronospora belbahrii]CAH0522482.1 unnamed protein product [Peronospora belbahrii]